MTLAKEKPIAPDAELQQMIAESDSGSRSPAGIPGKMLLLIPICWTLFQLWYSSPLPFIFHFGVFNDTEARAVHLAFAIFLSFTAYPALTSSPRDHIPIQDWVFALVGAFCASYLYLFYTEVANRSGAPTTMDLWAAGIGMVLLLEATRRALGPPLMVVAIIFLIYTFAGAYMPDVIAHKGASFGKGMSHFWLTTEGVFGVALGVSTNFVFLFVLFGALLDRAGAGNYFIQVAFSMLGHYRGGPAKAAVVSSGLSGIISGSSIANVVTTGTFTIPLMKRVGFPATKAGAIEVAASTNGQLTPPIMGAAAFLMVEYVGIPYIDVIKHAILPAAISYVALFYIVHLEAVKLGMEGLQRPYKPTLAQSLMNFFGTITGICILTAAVYYGIGWTKEVFGAAATWALGIAVLLSYVGLVRYAATVPELKLDDPNSPHVVMPPVGPTVKSGLYFLLPIVVLVWCLTVERFSPGLSAFWATMFMICIVITHRPLMSLFRKETMIKQAFGTGISDLIQGMASGARNMIAIGVATAAAGIVVGAVTLTGVGLVMTEFVEFISGGSVVLMLIFTAIISLILGMGLPTTANYIVVSTLMAPVIVALGAQNGLIVPLIAVHLFVFYFGILADDTPPVGLAAFAAAAIAQSDPIRTGIQGFIYDIRTAILPFMFIFNTQLLLIGVDSLFVLAITVASALTAMLVFAIATQGFWMVRTRWYEVIPLLLIAFTLFRPGFWWDMPYPELTMVPAANIYEVAEQLPENADLRFQVSGENLDGKQIEKIVQLPLGPMVSGQERIAFTGMELLIDGDSVTIDAVDFGGPANKADLDFDWQISELQIPSKRPPKQWMFIPALLLLAGVYLNQRRRFKREQLLQATSV